MTKTDLPTLEDALKLADQDSPLPSLAGPALKRMRQEINHYKGTVIHDEAIHDALLYSLAEERTSASGVSVLPAIEALKASGKTLTLGPKDC